MDTNGNSIFSGIWNFLSQIFSAIGDFFKSLFHMDKSSSSYNARASATSETDNNQDARRVTTRAATPAPRRQFSNYATGYMNGYTPPAISGRVDTNGVGSFTRRGIAVVDFDGSPTAYGPNGLGDDFLANAGHPGKWWGVATDRSGNPIINPENGHYVSTTSWASGPRGVQSSYVDAQRVPYVAMNAHDRAQGARNGDFVLLTNEKTGKQAWAVVADYAGSHPDNHTEVSAAAARALGLKFNKRGVEGRLSMQFFPGTGTGVFPRGTDADYIASGPPSLRGNTQYASLSHADTVGGLAGRSFTSAPDITPGFNGNAAGIAQVQARRISAAPGMALAA